MISISFDCVRIFGVPLDPLPNFSERILNVCKSAIYFKRTVQHIQLTCRRLFCVLQYMYIHALATVLWLQQARSAIASVVTFTRRTYHIRPVLWNLHWYWLPLNHRLGFKVETLAL